MKSRAQPAQVLTCFFVQEDKKRPKYTATLFPLRNLPPTVLFIGSFPPRPETRIIPPTAGPDPIQIFPRVLNYAVKLTAVRICLPALFVENLEQNNDIRIQ